MLVSVFQAPLRTLGLKVVDTSIWFMWFILKPQVLHLGCVHLCFCKPEVIKFTNLSPKASQLAWSTRVIGYYCCVLNLTFKTAPDTPWMVYL